MRIALLGNLANTAYAYTKALRNEGLKADVFITEKERKQVTTYPEWEDPEINSINSNWIHYYEQRNPISLFQTMTKLRSYDLIHAFGLPNIYCQFLGRPLITHALGADLKEVVYESGLTGYLLKRAFLRSKCVLFSDIDHIPHVNRLRLSQAQYFPAAVDINKYHPEVQARYKEKDKIILLHSSFLDWTQKQTTSKRNDLFFHAFSKFAKGRDDLVLRVIAAGPDTEITKELIYDLGISEIVEFLPPLNKQQLVDEYHKCDLIVDQFGMPKFGVNALEGMACGRPVFLYLDKDLAMQCYSDLPPTPVANGESEIYNTLNKICQKDQLKDIGTKCHEWIIKNHEGQKVARKLIAFYNKLIAS
jgi:glycosyltransferase involved in cell wall biosynthesis